MLTGFKESRVYLGMNDIMPALPYSTLFIMALFENANLPGDNTSKRENK